MPGPTSCACLTLRCRQVATRVRMEAALRRAIECREIEPYYQPQVDIHGKVIGAEALARWNHPERCPVSPAEFVPIAEQAGLILPLGRLMLERVCADLARWSEQREFSHLLVAVNVSALEFHDPGYVDHVLHRCGARATQLQLEITESVLLGDLDRTMIRMQALKKHGVSFSLDDFGTGFSSLAYLKRLPLDQIKIDKDFVLDVLEDRNDAAIVRSIIELAERFDIQVVAEGVQTEEVRRFLALHGCTTSQGFLFSQALPRRQFEDYIREGGARSATGPAERTAPRSEDPRRRAHQRR